MGLSVPAGEGVSTRVLATGHNPDHHVFLPGCPTKKDRTGKKHTPRVFDEKKGLMECLVCGEKYHTTMKADADGKFHPINGECVNKCRLIHHDEQPEQKK